MKTILIVDDRVINLEFLALLLEFAGYRVIKAANGAEGLDMARIAMPELVITDIVMPVMDGIELVNRLHADAATVHIPVIFYTATYNVKEVRLLANTLTAAAVLIKPADPQKILDLVAKALGQKPVSHDVIAPSAASPPGSTGAPHQLQQTLATASEATPGLHAYARYASGSMSTLGFRLAAFLELGVTLSTQRTSQDLLMQFCRGGKNIMNVSHVAVGMNGDGGLRFRASSGLPAREVDEIFDILDANGGFLRHHLASGATLDMHTMQAQAALQKMGPLHALQRKFLMVPIRPRSGMQGWFYMAGKRGTDDFNVADSEFAATLTVQLASLYDNLRLLEEAQEHVSRLEEEIHQRELVVARLQQSEAGRRIDTLTKLPNRISLYDRLTEAIPRSRRNGTALGCLYLDLDHFKQVNDTLGHASGDDLLKQFGARLQACVRETDMVARLAGDEFIVVVEGLVQTDGALCVSAKIIDAMQVPFVLAGVDHLITTSIGIAIADSRTNDPDSLLKNADEALYQAKRLGKNLYKLYGAPVSFSEDDCT